MRTRVQYEETRELRAESIRQFSWVRAVSYRQWIVLLVLAAFCIITSYGLYDIWMKLDRSEPGLIVIAILVGMFPIGLSLRWFVTWHYYRERALFGIMPNFRRDISLIIDDDGIRFDNPARPMVWHWKQISGYYKTKDFIILHHKTNGYVALPEMALNDAVIAFLATKIGEPK